MFNAFGSEYDVDKHMERLFINIMKSKCREKNIHRKQHFFMIAITKQLPIKQDYLPLRFSKH